MQDPVDRVEHLFADPRFEEAPGNIKKTAYLDPAFGGDDSSALSIGGVDHKDKPEDELVYITGGYLWKGQIDVTYNRVEKLCKQHNVSKVVIEANQAQRIIAYELRRRGLIVDTIDNTANKHLRIVDAVKVNWERIRFSKGVQNDYLRQILDYSELARHDDAPDSLAGLIRALGVGRRSAVQRYNGFSYLFRRR
jgi:predicted phage terminase large subunit-like protein